MRSAPSRTDSPPRRALRARAARACRTTRPGLEDAYVVRAGARSFLTDLAPNDGRTQRDVEKVRLWRVVIIMSAAAAATTSYQQSRVAEKAAIIVYDAAPIREAARRTAARRRPLFLALEEARAGEAAAARRAASHARRTDHRAAAAGDATAAETRRKREDRTRVLDQLGLSRRADVRREPVRRRARQVIERHRRRLHALVSSRLNALGVSPKS